MKILKNIIVKQVLTLASKEKLKEKFSNEKLQLHRETEQLRFEMKKLIKHNKKSNQSISYEQIEKKLQSRQEKLKLIDFQLQQLEILPIGSELKMSETQALIDVQVGDNWMGLERTIVVKDGVIHEIRE